MKELLHHSYGKALTAMTDHLSASWHDSDGVAVRVQ